LQGTIRALKINYMLFRCLAFAHFPGAMSTVSFGIITSASIRLTYSYFPVDDSQLTFYAVFLVLRTYALYYRRFWVLAITVPLGILNAVLAAICLMKVETIPFSIGTGELSSCIPELILSATPFKTLWSITIAFDTLISVLTISKTYQMHNASRKVGIESRLVVMILQDGSLYYCVMTAANVVNFAMFWAETFNYIETSAGISSEIIHSISVIIVCRMMLNIMEASDPQVGDYSDSQLESQRNLSSVRFVTQHSAITTGPRGHLMQQASESVHENAIGKGAGRPTLETVKEITMGTRTLQMTIDSSERSNHSMPVYDPFTQC